MKSPPVGLGDLVRAAGGLEVNADTAREIAALLGLAAPPREGAPALSHRPPPQLVETLPERLRPPDDVDDVRLPSAELASTGPRLALTIQSFPAPAPSEAAPPWLARPLPPAPAGEAAAAARPALEPLFEPARSRGLLSSVLATLHPEGEVEVERLVERVSRGRPVSRVPRRPHPTLRAGVQILVDRGAGMAPFARDAIELAARIRALAGASVTALLYFAEDPREAGPGARRRWRRYRPPASGTIVVALTDLGIHAPDAAPAAVVAGWQAFANLLRRAGCRLVALVPAPLSRFPRALAAAFTLIPWDRSTTLASARRALDKATREP
jgi:hypothetical protein